jgi:hypothetical protein
MRECFGAIPPTDRLLLYAPTGRTDASVRIGAIDIFLAIERCLDPTTREVLQAWIEKDVSMWRAKAMLGHPPNWRLNMIAGPRSAGRPLGGLDLRYAAGAMREGDGLRLLVDLTGPA